MAWRAVDRLLQGVLLVLMAAECIDIFLGVFSRYVLVRTFTWYDEIARLCFVWLVFLGAAVGVGRGAHYRLHLLTDRLAPGARRAAEVLAALAVCAVGAVLVQQGLTLVELGRYQQTPVMGLPKSYVYAAIPAGGGFMILYAIPVLRRALRGQPA